METTKRIYSIFSDGFCGYIFMSNWKYYERSEGVPDFEILDIDNYLLSLIYRGFSIKVFEPNTMEFERIKKAY